MDLLNFPGLHRTTTAFRRRLVELAEAEGLNANHIAAVIAIESGFRPGARNGKAMGLIQFYEPFFPGVARAARMAVEWKDLALLSAEQQLPLVIAFYRDKLLHQHSSATDYLVATFLPSQIGKPRETVVARRGSSELLAGTRLSMGTIYASNPTYDTNGDGLITIGDLSDRIEAVVAKAAGRPFRSPPISGGGWIALSLAVATAALAALALAGR
jgi:hypothetical protein